MAHKARVRSTWRFLGAVLALTPAWGFAQTGVPGFDFTFNSIPGAVKGNLENAICNIPGATNVACISDYGPSRDDRTSFIQETVRLGDVDYFHLVVGQPDQGFAQEILIKTGTRVAFGHTLSDSGGGLCLPGNRMSYDQMVVCGLDNNANTPLSTFNITGNGSGNPNAVLIKQVMTDPGSGFSQEFLKAQLDKKPIISQNLQNAGVKNTFVMDMSESTYNERTPAKMTNVTDVEGAGSFDADKGLGGSNEATGKYVGGGRYTYSADKAKGTLKSAGVTESPNGPSPNGPWNYGTYTYYDDPNAKYDDPVNPAPGTDFDFGQANWGVPIDPAQNRPIPPP